MKINVREWLRSDLPLLQRAWMEVCRGGARSDMTMAPNADRRMTEWLLMRFQASSGLGFIATCDGEWAGFLMGRVDFWEFAPPVVATRKSGIIDAIWVDQRFRQMGIATLLIENALRVMREGGAVSVETIYDAWDDASRETWHRAGFQRWMVHAYRML